MSDPVRAPGLRGLSAVFFLSGCAALLFESLWFRQTLLAFGSSVWASALVLSSFMAGIGLGNALAARRGPGSRRPVQVFALLELIVGLSGIALVLVLPQLAPALVPLFRPVLGSDALLQPLRFAVSFAVLLGPAVAMGATLPLLVSAISRRPEDFGNAFGTLYGWNTLGAVVGAVIGELWLLSILGVVGTAAVAASFDLLAAAGALVFLRARPELATRTPSAPAPRAHLAGRPARLLAATLLCGAILLALEVVWFRILMLFILATGRAFAVMLAIILAGLALGGLGGSAWLRRDPEADRHAWSVAFAAGALGISGYWVLGAPVPDGVGNFTIVSGTGLSTAVVLMLPVSLASGVIFALLGKSLNDCLDVPARSAGLLTLFNTIGAALGPLLAGFVLLPRLGMETSILLLCACYGTVALLCARWEGVRTARGVAVAAVAFLIAVATFPVGRMADTYLRRRTQGLLWPGAEVVALREGLTGTIQITRLDFLGEPIGHQLLTDGLRMSASAGVVSRRYMSLFVHLPVALHPQIRDALLISYGVGNTARALTNVDGMRSIDVVDISPEILDMSEVVFPDPADNPLHDPRVTVHVEDGRYFLQTTDKTFDLITGEPPPPRVGNVTYLYTKEYFGLAHERLRPGGLISYWLPVHQLRVQEAAAVIGAFCAVFEDCSLWNGASLNWILLGSRGGVAPVEADVLARQWRDERTAPNLRRIGIERPEALGALFIADAEQLRDLADRSPPLTDTFPVRIRNHIPDTHHSDYPFFGAFQDATTSRKRFASSEWIRRLWPESLRRETLHQFANTRTFDHSAGVLSERTQAGRMRFLRRALEDTTLEVLPLIALGVDPLKLEVAERKRGTIEPTPDLELTLGHGALARRAWSDAAAHYERQRTLAEDDAPVLAVAIYAHCRAGETDRALALRRARAEQSPDREVSRDLIANRGVDGCWAAAWGPDPAPAS